MFAMAIELSIGRGWSVVMATNRHHHVLDTIHENYIQSHNNHNNNKKTGLSYRITIQVMFPHNAQFDRRGFHDRA
jgi:hypothetical protein